MPTVVHELHVVIAQQRHDARDETLHEVEVWLGPVLEQLERETAAQLEREPRSPARDRGAHDRQRTCAHPHLNRTG